MSFPVASSGNLGHSGMLHRRGTLSVTGTVQGSETHLSGGNEQDQE